jgi:hypothetical protein
VPASCTSTPRSPGSPTIERSFACSHFDRHPIGHIALI